MSSPNMTPEAGLLAAHAEVKTEIARTDNKTALLLAFVGAVLAGAWTIAKDVALSVPAVVAGGAGLALLVGAAGLLLWSVRPDLRGRLGFPLWATLTAQEIATVTAGRDLAADVAGLSRLAVAKFTHVRRAVDLTCAGGALIILAVLLAAGSAA
jgi:hypothetical protein